MLTIEPGIYIADERFGIRLENDIVITRGKRGALNLFADVPIEADEIEQLMSRGRGRRPVTVATTQGRKPAAVRRVRKGSQR